MFKFITYNQPCGSQLIYCGENPGNVLKLKPYPASNMNEVRNKEKQSCTLACTVLIMQSGQES